MSERYRAILVFARLGPILLAVSAVEALASAAQPAQRSAHRCPAFALNLHFTALCSSNNRVQSPSSSAPRHEAIEGCHGFAGRITHRRRLLTIAANDTKNSRSVIFLAHPNRETQPPDDRLPGRPRCDGERQTSTVWRRSQTARRLPKTSSTSM